jgi:hypothetical protein
VGTINAQGQIALDKPLQLNPNSRVEVIMLVTEPETDTDDEPNESVLAGLRQAWREARQGQTIPLAELWDGIDVE